MNKSRGHGADLRTFSKLAFALALTMVLQVPAAAQAPEPYRVYGGGRHPVTYDGTYWSLGDPVYELYDPVLLSQQGEAITQVSLHGIALGDAECSDFRGVSTETGTLTPASGSPVFTIYDVVIEASPGLPVLSGKWRDSQGERGVFAAHTYSPRVDIGGNCLLFVHNWGFGQTSADPNAIVAYLQEQFPENRAPSAPELLSPGAGYTFQPDQVQAFSVRATDLDNDNYVGLIFVRRPLANDFDREWPTTPAASGDASIGMAPVPYPPDTDYLWKARASDGRLSSLDSAETRTFSVAS